MMSEMVKIEIDVPRDMLPYIEMESADMKLERNALFLHLYIKNRIISHGKAAELLGMKKLDLIELYSNLGLSYFDLTIEEVEEDAHAIGKLRSAL